jgi:heme exporter protein A
VNSKEAPVKVLGTAQKVRVPKSFEAALSVQGLTKAFGVRRALDGVSFDVPVGALLAIFGPNGAGKTTLLHILTTLARPSLGTVSLLGYDLAEDPDEIRAHIGLVSHRSMLYPDLTAEENLLTIARLYGVANPQSRVGELLAAVELTARRHDVVRGFSRGMTQRLAIARALIHDPELLFLDEPYSGLDPHAADILDNLIADMRTRQTLVMVSHDLSKGFTLASHVLMLARGKAVTFAATNEVDFADFSVLYRQTVGGGVA